MNVPGWISHVELAWDLADLVHGFKRLPSFSQLILFDKRGTGMSDLTAGSGLDFADQAAHSLKGVPEEWRLLGVM